MGHAASDLPPDYYCAFVDRVLFAVLDRFGSALPAPLVTLAVEWSVLGAPARRLYARLIQRRRPWVRLERVRWPEIRCVRNAASQLAARGLLTDRFRGAPPTFLIDLYSVAELRALLTTLQVEQPVVGGRAELVRRLATFPDTPALVERLRCQATIVRAEGVDRLRVFERLFFGTPAFSIAHLVAADVGTLRPAGGRAVVDCSQRLDRHGLPDWLLERRARALARRAVEDDWPTLLQSTGILARRRARRAALPAAVRHEQARLLHVCALPRPVRAIGVERRRVQRPRPHDPIVPERRLLLPAWPDGVERSTAVALAGPGVSCVHLENRFVQGLLGLLCYRIWRERCRDRFHGPLQSAPEGMLTGTLHRYCAPALLARFDALGAGRDPWPDMLATARQYRGERNGLVHWPSFPDSLIEASARCLNPRMLARLLWPLVADPHRFRHGFPDLVRLDPAIGAFECLEVKGPGDRLQPAQRRWLAWLHACDIRAAVVRVQREPGS